MSLENNIEEAYKCREKDPRWDSHILTESGRRVCPFLSVYNEDVCPYVSKFSQIYLVDVDGRGREYPICMKRKE